MVSALRKASKSYSVSRIVKNEKTCKRSRRTDIMGSPGLDLASLGYLLMIKVLLSSRKNSARSQKSVRAHQSIFELSIVEHGVGI